MEARQVHKGLEAGLWHPTAPPQKLPPSHKCDEQAGGGRPQERTAAGSPPAAAAPPAPRIGGGRARRHRLVHGQHQAARVCSDCELEKDSEIFEVNLGSGRSMMMHTTFGHTT